MTLEDILNQIAANKKCTIEYLIAVAYTIPIYLEVGDSIGTMAEGKCTSILHHTTTAITLTSNVGTSYCKED